ncbi:hypothetical protein H9L21_15035 [Aeromicrobium senzhongii]|uniref:Uncharacterized protein n=1 Tax=Aeromicrobium senzhongii TaxID=2663859 RepID=A0ABX6SSJ0_9ACTN|nr:hypothetical protein [Aeromicrobium senzhongii]MTB89498.1 hypothetical protein [Aeromicrobium senzhongii]QNL94369.1 hypothetical protein H9L21_15035 [Aeromicrobium senzhongii]
MRRPMRLTVGAGIAAGVLGLGTVGAAAVINNGALWFTSTSSGDSCEMEFAVHPVGPEDAASGEPATIMDGRTAWPSASEQEEVAEAARQYLADYDFDAIDRKAAIAETDATQRRIIAETDPEEAQPLLVGDDLEMHAVYSKVVRDLTAHLEGLGMDPHVINSGVGSSAGCAE